mmetsp:Transcript_34479/g.97691  ORF Transcript_34479/g.97691 Transcript_34479/m.97691 type:complete len:550 (-) Transcript_34479:303-1952(-)
MQLCARMAAVAATFGWKHTLMEIADAASRVGSLTCFLDHGGNDLLCSAVQSGIPDMTAMVLSLISEVNHWHSVTSVSPNMGVTALHVAAKQGDVIVLKLLISHCPGAREAWHSFRAGPENMTPAETLTKSNPLACWQVATLTPSAGPAAVMAPAGPALPVPMPAESRRTTQCSAASSGRSFSDREVSSSEFDGPPLHLGSNPNFPGQAVTDLETEAFFRDMQDPLLIKLLGGRASSLLTPLCLTLTGWLSADKSDLTEVGCTMVLLTFLLLIVIPCAYHLVFKLPAVQLRMAANYAGLTLSGSLSFPDPDVQKAYEKALIGRQCNSISYILAFYGFTFSGFGLLVSSWPASMRSSPAVFFLSAAAASAALVGLLVCRTIATSRAQPVAREWANMGIGAAVLAAHAIPFLCALAMGSPTPKLPWDSFVGSLPRYRLLMHNAVLLLLGLARAALYPAPMQYCGCSEALFAFLSATFGLSLYLSATGHHGIKLATLAPLIVIGVCIHSLSYFCLRARLEMLRLRHFVDSFTGLGEFCEEDIPTEDLHLYKED